MVRWQLEKSGAEISGQYCIDWLFIDCDDWDKPLLWAQLNGKKWLFSRFLSLISAGITTEGTISSKIQLCLYNVKTAVIHNMPILWVIHFLFMMSTKIFQNSASPPSPSTTIWFWSGPFLPFSAMDFHNWPLKNLWAHID